MEKIVLERTDKPALKFEGELLGEASSSPNEVSKQKYLGVAVAINGRIFAHPCDGTPEADRAAKARGDYPYTHLYEGDDICAIVAQMKEEEAARSEE